MTSQGQISRMAGGHYDDLNKLVGNVDGYALELLEVE